MSATGIRPVRGGYERMRSALPVLLSLIIPLLLLGPALAPGFVLSYDMVWVPDLALRADQLGLGAAVPRAVPSDAVIALLDEVVPGMLLQKLVLYGCLVMAALGASRLVGGGTVARSVAVVAAVWNPFVVERLWIGHWPVLLSYAVLPWLVMAGRRAAQDGRIPVLTYALLPLGSLSANAGLMSALALLVSSSGAGRVRARAALLCLAVNAPWIAAGLLHAGAAYAGTGTDVFALRGEGSLPAPLAALALGGVWNTEVVPASREGGLAVVALAVLGGLALLGLRPWWERRSQQGEDHAVALLVLWAVGYGLALATWLAPGSVAWAADNVPGGGLLRDGGRWLALCGPLAVSLVAAGAETLVGRVRPALPRASLAIGCALVPIAFMTDVGWGLGGALRPVEFPDEWADARVAIRGVEPDGDLLVLPFTSFRAPQWNGGRTVLDPMGRYLPRNFVVSDTLFVSGQPVPGEDPRGPEVTRALALPTPQERADALAAAGVLLVVRERDVPGAGEAPSDAEVAGTTVHSGATVEVVEVGGPVTLRTPDLGDRFVVAIGWLGLASVLPAVGARVVAGRVRRGSRRDESR